MLSYQINANRSKVKVTILVKVNLKLNHSIGQEAQNIIIKDNL